MVLEPLIHCRRKQYVLNPYLGTESFPAHGTREGSWKQCRGRSVSRGCGLGFDSCLAGERLMIAISPEVSNLLHCAAFSARWALKRCRATGAASHPNTADECNVWPVRTRSRRLDQYINTINCMFGHETGSCNVPRKVQDGQRNRWGCLGAQRAKKEGKTQDSRPKQEPVPRQKAT